MTDWSRWSRDAVELMETRNREWARSFGLSGDAFVWDLDSATLVFPATSDRGEVTADVRLAGTTSSCEGTFLWSWANKTLPPPCREGMERVRAFGAEHDLPLLTDPEWPGGRAEGLEMLAVAARILDAQGVFIDEAGDLTMLFVILGFRQTGRRPS